MGSSKSSYQEESPLHLSLWRLQTNYTGYELSKDPFSGAVSPHPKKNQTTVAQVPQNLHLSCSEEAKLTGGLGSEPMLSQEQEISVSK